MYIHYIVMHYLIFCSYCKGTVNLRNYIGNVKYPGIKVCTRRTINPTGLKEVKASAVSNVFSKAINYRVNFRPVFKMWWQKILLRRNDSNSTRWKRQFNTDTNTRVALAVVSGIYNANDNIYFLRQDSRHASKLLDISSHVLRLHAQLHQ